ncbi:uncharacterized protein [Musca autumnalis]|uniref:uncharacterized protein n=1 Tax=Musca autumnalis TaxID=221902 RepID=UPI003CE8C907
MSEQMSENNSDIVAKKIEEGEYILANRPNGRSIIWRVISNILKADGTVVDGYVCCKKCNRVLTLHGSETSNLNRHKCCREIRLSLNSNDSKNNKNGISETVDEGELEEFTDSSSSSSERETENNHKIKQSKHSFFLQSPSRSNDSEPIAKNTKEVKKAENSEDIPTIIAQKIEEGDYMLSNKANGRSIVWRVLSKILKPDGTAVEGYVCCNKCNKILKQDGNQTSNLSRHTCCRKIKLSQNPKEGKTKRFETFETTTNDEDVEEITDSRRSSFAREIIDNHERNQSKHSFFLKSPSGSEDSEHIVLAKKPKYSTDIPSPERHVRPETHTARLYPLSGEETYFRPEPLMSRPDLLQYVEKVVANILGKRDECDVFAEGWAIMYRKLTIEQRIYAKRLIEDTLLHAQLGLLTISSSLNLDPISISANRFRGQQQVNAQAYTNDEDNFSDT